MGGPRRTMYPAFVLAVFSPPRGWLASPCWQGWASWSAPPSRPPRSTGTPVGGRLVPRSRLTEGLAWMGTGLGIGVAVGSSVAGPLIDGHGYAAGFASVAAFGCAAALIAVGSLARLRGADTRAAAFDASIGERDTIVDEGTGTPLAPLRRMLPPCRGMDASTNLRSSAERAI